MKLRICALTLIVGFCLTGVYAFAPPDSDLDRPYTPPERSYDQPVQNSLSAQNSWQRYLTRYGPQWKVTWNEKTRIPHRIYGHYVSMGGVNDGNVESLSLQFFNENRALFQVDASDLGLIRTEEHAQLRTCLFQQKHSGLPVFPSMVVFRFTEEGRLVLLTTDVYPEIDVSTNPSLSQDGAVNTVKALTGFDESEDQFVDAELLVYANEWSADVRHHLAWRVTVRMANPPAKWVCLVDAHSGDLLDRWNEIYYQTVFGAVTGDIQDSTAYDPYDIRPMEHLQVDVEGYGSAITDALGAFSIAVSGSDSVAVSTELIGPYLNVNNSAGPDAYTSGQAAPGVAFDIKWDDANSQADERDCFYHANLGRDHIKAIDPAYDGIDYVMPCNVSISSTCNAYWDGYSINFFQEGGGCCNTGQVADVIYHEQGHGITEHQYDPYSPSGSQHEGWSDYWAATITDQPHIGRGFYGPGTFLRDCDNEMQYPDGPGCGGQVHCVGKILAGSLWHMRENLINSLGYSAGIALADSLFHYARYGYSTNFPDYLVDLLQVDDDDGDLDNGTPHYDDICQAFERHNLECPEIVVGVFITHTPVEHTEDTLNPYPVVAEIISTEAPLIEDSLFLYYTTGGGFDVLPMTPTGNPDEYEAYIPPQPLNTMVEYYIYGRDEAGYEKVDPAGAPAELYSFFVGIIVELFADNTESGAGSWTHTSVTGGYIDEWHLETSRNHTPEGTTSWKCGGTGLSDYDNLNDAVLVSEPIQLPSYGPSSLTFWHWIEAEISSYYPGECYDGGLVEISVDGGGWEVLTPVGGYPYSIRHGSSQAPPFSIGTRVYSGSYDWIEAEFDLSSYTGEGTIRFRFGSDGAVIAEGWYIDDIVVQGAGSQFVPFVRADANGDLHVDISDYLLIAAEGEAGLSCSDAGDVNDDGVVDAIDQSHLLDYLSDPYSPPPVTPYPECGVDQTLDPLTCTGHPCFEGGDMVHGGSMQALEVVADPGASSYLQIRGSAPDVMAYQVCMSFDPAVLRVDSLTLSGCLGDGGQLVSEIDNGVGCFASAVHDVSLASFADEPLLNIWYTALGGPFDQSVLNLADSTQSMGRCGLKCIYTDDQYYSLFPDIADGVFSIAPSFTRGDADGDDSVEMSDLVFVLRWLYVPDSPDPSCYDAADVDDDGEIVMGDATYLLKHLYVPDSPQPPAPFPECGVDPTTDELDCATHPCMGGVAVEESVPEKATRAVR